jgi:putative oxidoreductase
MDLRAKVRDIRAVLDVLTWLPPLVTRIILSAVFLQSGWAKISRHAQTIAFFSHLGFGRSTSFVAVFVPWVEFLAGIMLLLGVMTEIASIALIIDMTVAIVVANQDIAGQIGELFRFYDFLYIALLLWLLISGPGRVSAYRFVEKKSKYS